MEENSNQTNILWSFKTDNNCDSTEFCPSFENFFVCGNYELIESKKIGKLYLFEIEKNQENYKVKEHQKIETSAILDLKWSSKKIFDEKVLLGGALEDGKIEIWSLENKELKSLNNIQIDSSLCLSIDWNNRVHSYNDPKIIVSLSNGKIGICELNNSKMELIHLWNAHEYEAWIGAFDYFHTDVVFSGSDDCYFKGWDLRQSLTQSIFQKSYDVGVTTIQSNPHIEYQLAVGSYDDTLSIWDLRSMKLPISKINLGGGVWRVKWHPKIPNITLVACMRTGFKILEWKEETKEFQIIDEIQNQCESLAYGTDWCYFKDENWPDLVITGTFYDKTCSLWKPKNL